MIWPGPTNPAVGHHWASRIGSSIFLNIQRMYFNKVPQFAKTKLVQITPITKVDTSQLGWTRVQCTASPHLSSPVSQGSWCSSLLSTWMEFDSFAITCRSGQRKHEVCVGPYKSPYPKRKIMKPKLFSGVPHVRFEGCVGNNPTLKTANRPEFRFVFGKTLVRGMMWKKPSTTWLLGWVTIEFTAFSRCGQPTRLHLQKVWATSSADSWCLYPNRKHKMTMRIDTIRSQVDSGPVCQGVSTIGPFQFQGSSEFMEGLVVHWQREVKLLYIIWERQDPAGEETTWCKQRLGHPCAPATDTWMIEYRLSTFFRHSFNSSRQPFAKEIPHLRVYSFSDSEKKGRSTARYKISSHHIWCQDHSHFQSFTDPKAPSFPNMIGHGRALETQRGNHRNHTLSKEVIYPPLEFTMSKFPFVFDDMFCFKAMSPRN